MSTTSLSKRAYHDLSHSRRTSYPLGCATPTYCRVLAPGEQVSVDATDVFRLDPFAFPVMDTVQATHAWYAVPLHQLYEGFERFITGTVTDAPTPTIDGIYKSLLDTLPWMPYIDPKAVGSPGINDDVNTGAVWDEHDMTLNATDWNSDQIIENSTAINEPCEPSDSGRGGYSSLWDAGRGLLNQLGCAPPSAIYNVASTEQQLTNVKTLANSGQIPLSSVKRISALPFLAYHKIMDDYFRDEEMELASLDWPLDPVKHWPYTSIDFMNTTTPIDQLRFRFPITETLMINPNYWKAIRRPRRDTADSVPSGLDAFSADSGFRTRRSNWSPDYFNTRRPAPQRGEGEDVVIGSDGLFSIDELREATALQNFRLSQQRSGGRLDDFYRKQFGITDSSCHFGKCDYITHETVGLEISDVLQTSGTPETGGYTSTPQGNPVGYSKTVSRSGGVNYMAKSHCILMRISYVQPNPSYHAYVDPMFNMTSQFDFFTPQLEAIGWQPVPYGLGFPTTATVSSPSVPISLSNSASYAPYFDIVSGWQPPYENYRTQPSFNTGGFNPLYGQTPFDQYTFGRDFHRGVSVNPTGSLNPTVGYISPWWRKCDPSNAPFAVSDDSPTQVQHFTYFSVRSKSPVPHVVNNRCLTH